MCLGPSEFSGQGAERVGLDDLIGLCLGESAPADEISPAVVLGDGGDGLVLGRELGDRGPPILFGLDHLVRRQFGAGVLEDPEQHGSC